MRVENKISVVARAKAEEAEVRDAISATTAANNFMKGSPILINSSFFRLGELFKTPVSHSKCDRRNTFIFRVFAFSRIAREQSTRNSGGEIPVHRRPPKAHESRLLSDRT